MSNFCSQCGQRLPEAPGRVCGICHARIRKGDKYHFVGSVVQHRSCEDPKLAKAEPSKQESFLEVQP